MYTRADLKRSDLSLKELGAAARANRLHAADLLENASFMLRIVGGDGRIDEVLDDMLTFELMTIMMDRGEDVSDMMVTAELGSVMRALIARPERAINTSEIMILARRYFELTPEEGGRFYGTLWHLNGAGQQARAVQSALRAGQDDEEQIARLDEWDSLLERLGTDEHGIEEQIDRGEFFPEDLQMLGQATTSPQLQAALLRCGVIQVLSAPGLDPQLCSWVAACTAGSVGTLARQRATREGWSVRPWEETAAVTARSTINGPGRYVAENKAESAAPSSNKEPIDTNWPEDLWS